MGLGSSFDVTFREMSFGGHKTALLCLSGFTNEDVTDEILKRLTYLSSENLSAGVLGSFMNEYIPHIQVEEGSVLSECFDKVLKGMSALFIEGENKVILMDTDLTQCEVLMNPRLIGWYVVRVMVLQKPCLVIFHL